MKLLELLHILLQCDGKAPYPVRNSSDIHNGLWRLDQIGLIQHIDVAGLRTVSLTTEGREKAVKGIQADTEGVNAMMEAVMEALRD